MINKSTFKCKKCGKCCKPVVIMSKEDIETIKKAGHKDFLELDPIHPENGYISMKRENDYCMFLDKTTKQCKIYDVRPEICRIYPFMEKDELKDCVPTLF